MDAFEKKRALREGLVPSVYEHMYTSNLVFKMGIDRLVEMLPLWVEGIALHAYKADQEYQVRLVETLKRPPRPILITLDEARHLGIG